MKYLHHTIRIITGLFLLFLAGSKFGFLPTAAYSPELFTDKGWPLIQAIVSTGYIFPTIGIISLICGIAFLTNRYVALAALLMVPITFNFLLFHVFTDLQYITLRGTPAYIAFGLIMYMVYSQRAKYSQLLKSK